MKLHFKEQAQPFELLRAVSYFGYQGAELDYLADKPEVDPSKIALMGMSMGGYYVPRAAAFDNRIKACITYDIFCDVWQSVVYKSPALIKVLKYPNWLRDNMIKAAMKHKLGINWQVNNALWVFGVKQVAELEKVMKSYSLDGVLDRIECPVLLLAGEEDKLVDASL